MADRGDVTSLPPPGRRRNDRSPAVAIATRNHRPDASPRGTMTALSEPVPYTPKRGRPTAATVAAINEAILQAATERFLEDGYDGSSMEAIAAMAGVSKGTLYSRYADKKVLLHAVIARSTQDWPGRAAWHDRFPNEGLKQRLQYYVDSVMTWAVSGEMRAFRRLLAGSSGVPQQVGRVAREFGYRSAIDTIEQIVRQCTADEGKPAQDSGWIAVSLMATLSGWIYIESALGETSKEEALAFGRRSVDLLLAARDAW